MTVVSGGGGETPCLCNILPQATPVEDNPVVKAWVNRTRKGLQPHFDEANQMTYRTREMYPKIAQQLARL